MQRILSLSFLVEKSIFLHVAEMIPKLKSRIQKQHQQQQAAQQTKQTSQGGGKGKGKKRRWTAENSYRSLLQ